MGEPNVVSALAPAFAAGFGVQRLLELLGWGFDMINPPSTKKLAMSTVAFAVGMAFAIVGNFGVLASLTPHGTAAPPAWLDTIVTGLVISGGTEGFNSILKFIGYAKDNQKGKPAAERVSG